MPEDPEGNEALTNFPLLWRWNGGTQARLSPGELESIRPLPEDEAAALVGKVVNQPAQYQPVERLQVSDASERLTVARWLDDVIPYDACELWLVWDRRTAVRVPRDLFVRRWDDFWYPSSDDLSVIGTGGRWHLEMYHYGSFVVIE